MADAMANINALIAQGPKPIQLNDPLGQMAKMYQIKSAQQELTANEQKLAEANALREFLKSNPDLTSSATLNKLTTGFGPTGLAYGTKLLEIEKARRAERTAEQKLVDDKTKYFRDALSGVNTPDDARMWTAAIYSDPNLGPVFKGMGVTAEQAIARIPTDPAQFENWKRNAALGATKFAELNKPQFFQQDLGGSRRIIAMPGMGGAAEVVPGSAALKTAPPRYAINPVTGVSELLSSDTVRPAGGQPGAAPLVPGIAPVQAQQNQTGGFPRVTPQVQAARDTDRLAILERELASQQAAGRVDPALQAEIDNARRQAGVPAPQPRVSVPNALAGASVNALAGAPTGAPIPANPAERMAAFKKQLEVAGAGPEAETKKRHELLVDQYKDISKAAQLASKTLPALESNLAILDRGFTTGFGTEAMAAGAKVLGALGVQNAEKFATNSQTFLANATQSVLQRQLEQKGTQSEGDYQRIKDTGSQLGNTKEANKFILSVAKAQLQRDIDQRKFYDQWQKQNKTYDGAEDAWFSGEGGKSLFDTPALREYSSKTPTGGAVSPQGRPSLDSIFGGKPQR
jgi:hypothetical protein